MCICSMHTHVHAYILAILAEAILDQVALEGLRGSLAQDILCSLDGPWGHVSEWGSRSGLVSC